MGKDEEFISLFLFLFFILSGKWLWIAFKKNKCDGFYYYYLWGESYDSLILLSDCPESAGCYGYLDWTQA